MAITRDDFQSIPSSGIIPDDLLPATEFAVSYFFSYTGTPSLLTFNHTFTGTLVLHVIEDGAVKYVVTIKETYNLFIFPLAPGLVLYTWNWVPSAEQVSGTIGEAAGAPPMTTLGEGSFGVDPAEGSGTSDGEVIVDSRFYYKIFTEPLAVGDILKIKFHNLSAGFVVARASLQIATERGVPLGQALRDPRVGTVWWFYAKNAKIYCAFTRNDEGFVQRSDDPIVYDGAAAYFRAFRHGATLYAWVQDSGTALLLESRDEGVGWMGTFALQESIKVLATQLSDDGGAFYIYGQATATVVSNSPDNPAANINQGDMLRIIVRLKGTFWEVAEVGVVEGDNLPDKNIIAMEGHKRTLYLMSNVDEMLQLFRSTDELKTLEALPNGE